MNSKINTAVKPPYPKAEGRLEATHHLIKFSLVENVLIFPTGLTLEQAKHNAKELEKEQSLSHADAMKCICWGNGIHNVQSFNEALLLLVKSTFGIEHTELGLYSNDNSYTGFWWLEAGTTKYTRVAIPSIKNTEKNLTSMLVDRLLPVREDSPKQVKFLNAVKDCLIYLGRGYTLAPHRKNLNQVQDIYEIDIDIKKLIFDSKGSADKLLSYALASCYNTRHTTELMMSQSLAAIGESLGMTKIDLSNKYEREELANGFRYPQFGDMCMQLDN
ncbi:MULTISPECIES: hypothetical protein [unclassified Shewanella]|uniref:hypothetical protein n=1 Tax=unclassified Shewanella TaxID=196818 RepID=UPI001BBC5123|nr:MULTISPECIES: hypothetical protein [unclassified Shewanella]GIU21250.1 hypothetical protein TUM4444_40520 [Shewanella sp. MBTL60-112-B1]GIU33556.1 hypothetical protein TUM4445_20870 [Shewanella sp. MBTL60-112-B2]